MDFFKFPSAKVEFYVSQEDVTEEFFFRLKVKGVISASYQMSKKNKLGWLGYILGGSSQDL